MKKLMSVFFMVLGGVTSLLIGQDDVSQGWRLADDVFETRQWFPADGQRFPTTREDIDFTAEPQQDYRQNGDYVQTDVEQTEQTLLGSPDEEYIFQEQQMVKEPIIVQALHGEQSSSEVFEQTEQLAADQTPKSEQLVADSETLDVKKNGKKRTINGNGKNGNGKNGNGKKTITKRNGNGSSKASAATETRARKTKSKVVQKQKTSSATEKPVKKKRTVRKRISTAESC